MSLPSQAPSSRFRRSGQHFYKIPRNFGFGLMVFAIWPLFYSLERWSYRVELDALNVGIAAFSVGCLLWLYGSFRIRNPLSFLQLEHGTIHLFSNQKLATTHSNIGQWQVIKRIKRSRTSKGSTYRSTIYVVLNPCQTKPLYQSANEQDCHAWIDLVDKHLQPFPRKLTPAEQNTISTINQQYPQLSATALLWLASATSTEKETTPEALNKAASALQESTFVFPNPNAFDRFWCSNKG